MDIIVCVKHVPETAEADIRIAAGREYHLRSMQVMSLYPANSLFMTGYLNTSGTTPKDTIQMIKDAGFKAVTNIIR